MIEIKIELFKDDNPAEFKIGAKMKPGSLWVVQRKHSWWRYGVEGRKIKSKNPCLEIELPEPVWIDEGTVVMILEYCAGLYDHSFKFLSGPHIYKACVARGELRNYFGLLCNATQDYDIQLD